MNLTRKHVFSGYGNFKFGNLQKREEGPRQTQRTRNPVHYENPCFFSQPRFLIFWVFSGVALRVFLGNPSLLLYTGGCNARREMHDRNDGFRCLFPSLHIKHIQTRANSPCTILLMYILALFHAPLPRWCRSCASAYVRPPAMPPCPTRRRLATSLSRSSSSLSLSSSSSSPLLLLLLLDAASVRPHWLRR